MTRQQVAVGVDIGTSNMKALAFTIDGQVTARAKVPSHWVQDQSGTTTKVEDYYTAVTGLLTQLAAELADTKVVAIGFTGLAETGAFMDERGQVLAPAIAWHDPRGVKELGELVAKYPQLPAEFVYRTGLPWDSQPSFAKLAWLQANWPDYTKGARWLAIPEYLTYRYGGEQYAEYSQLARTGLLDHLTGGAFALGLEALGLPDGFIPPLAYAGSSFGQVNDPALGEIYQGAYLTVAGHDHPVACFASGARSAGEVFNSCGTADVISRTIDTWPSEETMVDLAKHGIGVGHHIVAGTYVLNSAVRAGLTLNRVKSLLAGKNAAGIGIDMTAVDQAYLGPDFVSSAVEVRAPGVDDAEVIIALRGETSPVELWSAAVNAVIAQEATGLAVMNKHFGHYQRALAGGGYANVHSIRVAKQKMLPGVEFVNIDEPGCQGAALTAWNVVRTGALPGQDPHLEQMEFSVQPG